MYYKKKLKRMIFFIVPMGYLIVEDKICECGKIRVSWSYLLIVGWITKNRIVTTS